MIKKKVGAFLRKKVTNSPWFSKQFLDCNKFWNLKTFSNQVAFIGSDSGHYGCNFSKVEKRCVDMTMRDSTILQNFEVLRNYSSYLKENDCTVVMVISPFDFLTGSTTYFEDRYYSILNLASIPGFSYERRSEVLSRKNNPILYYPLFELRKRNMKGVESCITTEEYVNHIKQRYSIRSFDAKLTMLNEDSFIDSVEILKKMNQFCNDHGFKFILSFPPVSQTFAGELKMFMNNVSFMRMMDNIKASGIDVKDMSYDIFFAEHPELFRSDLFLNIDGAALFTKKVIE